MSNDAVYHRTFLPDGRIDMPCRQNCHGNGSGMKSNRLTDFEPQFLKPRPASPALSQFRVADMTIRENTYYPSQRRRAAYMYANGQLRSIFIVDKIDQEFGMHATLWEIEYSSLVRDGADRFLPVVDENYTVVGHIG